MRVGESWRRRKARVALLGRDERCDKGVRRKPERPAPERAYRWHTGPVILEVLRLHHTRRLSSRRIARRLAGRGVRIGARSVARILASPERCERELRRMVVSGQLSQHAHSRVLPWLRSDSGRSPDALTVVPAVASAVVEPASVEPIAVSLSVGGAATPGCGLPGVPRMMTDDEFAGMLSRLFGRR